MTDYFNILHFSDAHIGRKSELLNEDEVFAPFFSDLTQFSTKGIIPNLIIMSGDLCFGEYADNPLQNQFERAREWITNLFSSFKVKIGSIPFMIVVGNHDMDRLNKNEAYDKWIDAISSTDQLKKAMYSEKCEPDSAWLGVLSDRQLQWAKFIKSMDLSPFIFNEKYNVLTGNFNHGTHKIGVVGLNSSWSSYKKEQSGLWLGETQIQLGLREIKDCDLKIAVTHHPLSYIHETERSSLSYALRKFQMHFYGHFHEAWYVDEVDHLCSEGGACFCGADKTNAYSLIQIDLDGTSKNKIHLRTYEKKGQGWIPLVISGRTDNEGVAILHSFSPLRKDNERDVKPAVVTAQKQHKPFSEIKSTEKYIDYLEENFSFRWEPFTYENTNNSTQIYWYVRLRKPTPIHALQSFAASGLQKLGAKIVLCLDDFGNLDMNVDTFCDAIRRWFCQVGADFSTCDVQLCSEIIKNSKNTWSFLQNWWKDEHLSIKEVLMISKLLREEEIDSITHLEFLKRKPKRLMTPPIVWSCLAHLKDKCNDRFITLGGYDEMPLWEVWRNHFSTEMTKNVGHLYIPTLMTPTSAETETLRMAEVGKMLEWTSVRDIANVLNDDLRLVGDIAFLSENRIIPWCINGCSQLPNFIKGAGPSLRLGNNGSIVLSDGTIITDNTEKLKAISDNIAEWVLENKNTNMSENE